MTERSWVDELFDRIDAKDTEAFVGFLDENVLFQFGNASPLRGRPATATAVQGFFDSIQSIRHELADRWEQGQIVVCHGHVTYTRHDATTLRVPFANIFRLASALIVEYRIYADLSELYRGT